MQNLSNKNNSSIVTGLLLSFLFITSYSYCQKIINLSTWDNLKEAYISGKIKDTIYLNAIVNLNSSYDNSSDLKERLSLFKEIAFSNKKYFVYRNKYFAFLANNAMWSNNNGRCIFYLQKMEEQLKESPDYIPTLSSSRMEIGWLTELNNPIKGLEKSRKEMAFIQSLPNLITKTRVHYRTVQNAQFILKYTQGFYLQLKDTNNAFKILKLSKKILNTAIQNHIKYSDEYLFQLQNDIFFMEYEQNKFLNNDETSEYYLKILFERSLRAKSLGYVWAQGDPANVAFYLINLLLDKNQVDSAERYLSIFQKEEAVQNQPIELNREFVKAKSEIEKIRGNYKDAFKYLKMAYDLNDSTINNKTADINNNLYAQAEAEYNREELFKQEKQKQQRTIYLSIIILLLASLTAILFLLMQKKEKIAKTNIEKLNFESQLQIAELEEGKRIAKQEEKRRLGMELHDDLASSLATIKINVDNEIQFGKDTETNKRLNNIKMLVETAYQNTRNKSHEWFNGIMEDIDASFSQRISSILEKGLPLGKYEKEILIDAHSLHNTTLNEKIELLYIIQEAVTNILKHAKANKICILIYEDIGGIILQISDNGIGFKQSKIKSGIGLSSIQERVKKLNGKLGIQSGKEGTEITITIPFK